MLLRKMIFKTILLFVLYVGLVEANPLGGRTKRRVGMDITTNPVNVLLLQMNDMQQGSTLVAYQLASPANRAFTARPNGYNQNIFNRMVNNGIYKGLLEGYGYEVTNKGYLNGNSNQYFADVKVFRSSDRRHWIKYRFTMSLQPSNVVDEDQSLGPYKLVANHRPVWRTDSVYATLICKYCGMTK